MNCSKLTFSTECNIILITNHFYHVMTENKTKNITFSLFIDVVCYMHLANSVGYSSTAFLDLIVVSCFVTVRSDNRAIFREGMTWFYQFNLNWKIVRFGKQFVKQTLREGRGGGNLTFIFLRGNGPFQLCLKYKARRPDLFWS